jgi:hypothetical protein
VVGGVAQVVQHVFSKLEALSSTSWIKGYLELTTATQAGLVFQSLDHQGAWNLKIVCVCVSACVNETVCVSA